MNFSGKKSETYVICEVGKGLYDVTKFIGDFYETHEVKITSRSASCTCFGFRVQKDKTQHKHCLMVKFWIENLDKEPGYAFWYEGEDLEFNKFIDFEAITKYMEVA